MRNKIKKKVCNRHKCGFSVYCKMQQQCGYIDLTVDLTVEILVITAKILLEVKNAK